QSIVDIAHKVGIESPIDPVPSMIYGVSDMRVYEMVSAFGTFANKGVNIQPIFVTRIEDKNGNLLSTFMPRLEEAINDQTAYLMLNAMKEATNSGTAIRLRTYFQFEAEIASKTGTTQNHSDGWFMGIVPNLVTGIWVGAEDRSVHFDELSLGSGSNMALPIWGHYMSKVYADSILNITQKDTFEVPEYLGVEVDCDAYERNTYDTPVDYSPVEIGY
ncbi:MAG: penicillin-binding transpeptidase domain-containing protein, partial [Bacteroidota bacterium]